MTVNPQAPLMLACAVAAAGLLGWATPAPAQSLRGSVGQAWVYMEAGNLRKAENAFMAAFKTPEGAKSAEVYYGIAAVWWERRNAMAAYMWLSDAQKAAGATFDWDAGPDGEYDKRIASRRRYVEKNFTVVKLRAPKRGKPLPPLADPPPADPLLVEFTDRLSAVVAEGIAAKMAVQWVLLPNGSYWVGDDLVVLDGGELDPARADSWDLLRDAGKDRKAYDARVAALKAGESPAEEQLAALAAKEAEAADAAERRRKQEEKARQERLAALEAERKAEDEARAAEARRQRERAAAEEAERVEAERMEAQRRREAEEAERLESRRAAEAAEARRAEEARRAKEAARLAERERAARERREAEEAEEARRVEAERVARERREAEEAKRLEQARIEREAAERSEAERVARERREAEEARAEEARRDQERRAAERKAERERREAEAAAERRAEEERRRRYDEERAEREARAEEERRTAVAERERREAEEADRRAEARAEARRAEEEEAAAEEERRREQELRRAARERRAEEERLAAAQARREREAADERTTDDLEREDAIAAERARRRAEAGILDDSEAARLRARRVYVAGGAGGVSVSRLTDESTSTELHGAGHFELGVALPLPADGLAFNVALSYANLPVSMCSAMQTRSHVAALHFGPRIGVHVTERLWFALSVGAHVGLGGTWTTPDARNACAGASLAGEPNEVAYGVRLTDGAASGRVAFADLGWQGYSFALGPQGDVGILVAPPESRVYFGVSFFARHDQLFALLRGGTDKTYFFRPENEESTALGSATLGAVSGTASMARFQFGIRGRMLF